MQRDSPSRRTRHPDLYAGPAPSDRAPSWRATLTFAALPALTLAVAAFPTASAFAAASLVGAIAGAALHRRYPDAFDRAFGRALSAPADEPAGAADG
ncbi:hypothetical protein [Halorubrum lipolyticum]|uniref:Uncharacterized protein n=1 Tax=Halorubrum lipolyticum DSM 21995 TaxID=1227482 RepID=M0NU69_9EURY|nr:hypothetical protein [Halorubrum lipolyticum]EMA60799.1 hypothetical protein C469_08137 [Halorubrum lipolyticum DSM 21995]